MRSITGLLLLAAAPGFAAQAERSLPLFFFPNSGQTDSSIRYIAETPELRAGFRADSIVFQVDGMRVEERFSGADAAVAIEASEPLPGTVNFFDGQTVKDWTTGLPTFHKIVYRGLYPGIDMTYGGSGSRIKSDFIVAPGADPNRIRLVYESAGRIYVDANGDLVVTGSGAELREEAPVIYQDGGHTRIEGHYRLLDAHTVGFEIGVYDASKVLIIDPVISYCTYLGGTSTSAVTGLAVDSAGDLYVTGWTAALNFPIAGAFQAANQGGVDVFVAKLNPTGTALIYATYIGGRADDQAAGIAVDTLGQAYVTGFTASTNFPLVAAIRSTLGGSRNAFALKLNATGNTLLYSTYLGGTAYDQGTAIAVDTTGNAYIAGDTQSANFPVLHAAQGTLGGQTDAFVTKLTSSGALSFSTFLGGAAAEHAGGIAVDSGGNVYVTGGTFSTNFPTVNPIQSINAGGQDAFAAKLGPSGSTILYSTYLGGSGGTPAAPEQANAIAIDATGAAYVAGVTNSVNFPITPGAFQTSFGGVQDAFISKLNAAGNTLVYSTYLGATSFDWATGISVDSSANAYVAGYTSSSEFPQVSAVQPAFNGLYDAFVSEINAAGNAVVFSTFYGGSGADIANAIALDQNANIFTGGETGSVDLPLQTPIYSANLGGSTGWLLRLGITAPQQTSAAISVTPSSGTGSAAIFTAQYSDTAGAAALNSVVLLMNTSAASNYACYVSYIPASNQFTLANDIASSGSTTVIPGGGSAQNSQCTLNGAGSSATLSGNNLTLTISLSFQPGFAAAQTVYLSATDSKGTTGLIARGTWTATNPPPQPSASSVSPNGSTGASQNFTFVFSDSQNAGNLADMAVLFSPSLVYPNSCYIVYDAAHAMIQLAWDSALGSDSKAIGSTSSLQNSQCTVGATSATISGLSVILTANITFQGTFTGSKNIYMYGVDANGANTGWVPNGTYTVAAGGVPVASSVVPASGSGPSQRFSFTVSDQGGSGFLTDLTVVIGSSTTNLTNSCVLVYARPQNVISLSYDIPSHGAAQLTPGSNTVISNSQCIVNGANTTVAFGATTMTVTVDLAFNDSYFGAKNIYLNASEQNSSSGWVDVGSWTVTGGAPTADSVSPASGTGGVNPTQFFTLTVSDSASYANLSGLAALFTVGAPTNTANACSVVYNYTAGTVGLYANDGVTLNTKGLGFSTTLQNSQCAVGSTGASLTAHSIVFTIEIQFKAAFDGPKTVYLEANEASSSSGWVSRGTWTVQ